MKDIITSRLSKEQFLEALKLYGRDEKELWEFRMLSEKVSNFYYKINGDSFSITKPTYLRHPLKSFFRGRVSSIKSGSKIQGEFTMPLFVKLFMTFWFTGIIYVFYLATSWIGPAIVNGAHDRDDLIALSFVILFFLLWIGLTSGMFRWSWQLRKQEEEVILSFIKDVSRTSLTRKNKTEETKDNFNIEDLFVKYKLLRYLLMLAPMIGGIIIWFQWGHDQLSAIILIVGTVVTFFNFYNSKNLIK